MPEDASLPPFQWVGGNLALDFTNTVSWRPDGLRNERLVSYEALVEWARGAGIVKDPRPLLGRARRSPGAAARALEQALTLRSLLHDVLSAPAHGRRPDPGRWRAFNAALTDALGHLQVEPARTGFVWAWTGDEADLERPLRPVVRAAAELLTSDERALLKDCANDHCGWLFVDRSRRGNRRWCEMRECGNRAKARRYYRRAKAARSG
jgi:predicted RNA-binding Zn ribbon-like protein